MITSTTASDLHSQAQPQPNLKPRTRFIRTQAQWKAMLEEFNTSGLTKSAFCKKHRIATSSRDRWQQRVAEQMGDLEFVEITQPLSNAPAPPPTQVRDNDWQGELEVGAGVVLRLRTT